MTLESEARKAAEARYGEPMRPSLELTYPADAIYEHRKAAFVSGASWAVSRITPVDVLAVASRHFPVEALREGIAELWTCDCGESYDILIEHQVEKIVALIRNEAGGDSE